MKLIRYKDWIKGSSYQKRILLTDFDKQINLIEDVIIKANGDIPLHNHKLTEEIFYITKNSAVMTVDDEKFKVNEGDMIYVDKNEKHGFENKSNEELKMIVMKINFHKGDSYLKV